MRHYNKELKEHFYYIDTAEELKEYVKDLSLVPLVFDTETKGLAWHTPLLIISLYDGIKDSAAIMIDNPYCKGISLEDARGILNPVFSNAEVIGHNIKFDIWQLTMNSFSQPKEIVDDTMVSIHVYNPDLLKKLELRVREDLKYPKKTFEEINGKKWNKIKWGEDTDADFFFKMAQYACEDVYFTYQLHEHYKPLLEKQGTTKILRDIELPLIPILKDMQERGVNIDIPVLQDLSEKLNAGIKDQTKLIYALSGCVFNLNSPKQVAEVLYDKMGYAVPFLTKKGARKADKFALQRVAASGGKIADELILHSQMDTLLGSFVDKIPLMVDADGKLRCSLNSCGAVTGRFSSSEPNLQNQPNNKDYPVRKAFIASEGCVLIDADLSQIEPRIMAHVSKDPKLIQIFVDGKDVYLSIVEDLRKRSVTIDRDKAKVIQLAVSYELGSDSLAQSIRVTKTKAEEFLSAYYETYNVFRDWKYAVKQKAIENGYVRSIFGRIRQLPGVHLRGPMHYSALRQAINTSIQGPAADYIKISLRKLANTIATKKLFMWPLLTVHDEFLFDVQKNVPGRVYHIEECYDTVIYEMENAVKLRVPVKAEGKVINNWSEMKDKSFVSLHLQDKLQLQNPENFDLMFLASAMQL